MNFLPAGAAALDAEGDDRAGAARQQPLRELMVRMILQRGMQHPVDRLVGGQGLEHRERVAHVALHADAERLDALQQLERVGRRQARAEIAQAFGARAHDEGGLAELLVEDDAVIAGIGLGQLREFAGGVPVEPAAIDDDAADRDAVAADPFGRGVHHEVGAELDRPAEKRRRKGVVDQQRNLGVMRDLRDRRNIQHLEPGIADGLADHEPRVRLDRGAEFVERARLDEGRGDAEARQRVRQQVDGAAIERGGGDDVVAGVEQRRDRQMQRGHAACRADRADAVFQRGEPLLEHRRRRIGDAGVDVAGAFQVEQRGGVVGILEHVGRGLVDRNRAGAGGGIRDAGRRAGSGFRRQAAWVRACGARQITVGPG